MPARRAESSWKAARAVELVREGKSYDQVARALGYANRGTAHRVVTKALSERMIDGIDDLRDIEVAAENWARSCRTQQRGYAVARCCWPLSSSSSAPSGDYELAHAQQ